MKDTIIVRGGGDIASGIIQKLYRSGFRVIILEIENPTFIRRSVCFGEAVYEKEVVLEGCKAKLANSVKEVVEILDCGYIAVYKDSMGESISKIQPQIVIDAILAKKNLGTNKSMAPITIGVGPGFTAGKDVDAVIETMRGHNLGRLILDGEAKENTGIPGKIEGYGKERVVYSPRAGRIRNIKKIGDIVQKNEVLAYVEGEEVITSISGVLRGLIKNGHIVSSKMKIGDVDPRIEEVKNCFTISDKSRNIGGAVLEAVMFLKRENK